MEFHLDVSHCGFISPLAIIVTPTLAPLLPVQSPISPNLDVYASTPSITSHEVGPIIDFGIQSISTQNELFTIYFGIDICVLNQQVDVFPIFLWSDVGEAHTIAPTSNSTSSSILPYGVTVDISIKILPTNIHVTNSHPMLIRIKACMFKLKSFQAYQILHETKNHEVALLVLEWNDAMTKEFNSLISIGTWELCSSTCGKESNYLSMGILGKVEGWSSSWKV